MSIDTSKLTRIEIIDHRKNSDQPGRIFSLIDPWMAVEAATQDDGKTLKLFLSDVSLEQFLSRNILVVWESLFSPAVNEVVNDPINSTNPI